MGKLSKLMILVVVLTLLGTGCGAAAAPTVTPPPPLPTETPTATPVPTATPTPVPAFPLTLRDDAGREVTLSQEPQRIVSLAPSNTETLYALGLGERVVGVTEFDNYPPEVKRKPVVGGFADVNLEQVVAQRPDLVLATGIHTGGVVEQLEQAGLTVFVIEPTDVAEVIEKIRLVGRITGVEEAAQALADDLSERVEAIEARVAEAEARPRVFYELSSDLYTAGPGSFIHDLILRAGGENIAAQTGQAYPQLSSEVIVEGDPQVIFLGDANYGESAETVAARPGWSQVTAVREGRMVAVTDDDIVSRPGPRIVQGLELIARGIHPELFGD